MSADFDDSMFDIDNQHNKRERCLGVFYTRAVQNQQKSAQEERPIFEDKVYIKIIVPGSKDEVDRLARDEDKERFPDRWAAFHAKKETPVTGTPMTIWHEVGPSQAAEMAAANVTSVDQLALLSDDAVQRLGPGYIDLRKKAQEFITMRDRAKTAEGLRERIKELEAENADLKARVIDAESKIGAKSEAGKGQPKNEAPPKRKGKNTAPAQEPESEAL